LTAGPRDINFWGMKKTCCALVIFGLLIFSFFSSHAQIAPTGEIRGTIVSYETEEPLPGANVAVLGTEFKAAADREGNFVLKNLPAGVYQVQASLIGYLETKLTSVEVKANLTTRVHIRLRPSPIILDREVLVVGEKPMLDLKAPSTKRELTLRELELVPATDLKEIVSQQVGVIQDKSELHIRGGRSYENVFLLDDLLINDPFSRSGYGVAISPSAVQRINLVSGGLNAGYCQVTAGVVDVQVREGTEKFEGSLTYKADEWGFNSSSSFNTDLLDISCSGPADFLSSALSKTGLRVPGNFFFFANANLNLSDTHLNHPAKLYSSSFGKSSYSPREDNRFSGILKLTWKDPRFKFSFTSGKSVVINQDKSVLLTRIKLPTYSYGPPYEYSGMLENYNTFTHESNFQILSFQKIMGERHLLSVSLSRYFTNLHSDVNGKNWSQYNMPVDIYPFEIQISPDSSHYVIVKGPDGFYDLGDGDSWYDHYVETYGVNLRLVRVISDIHTLRLGLFEEYQTIQLLDIYKPWLGQYGFGLSHDLYKVYANDGSLYIENELKLEQARFDVGLRYDFWFPGRYVERAVEDTTLSFITPQMRADFEDQTFELLGYRGKGILSPRFGFSAPIATGTSCYFNYARLSRRPNPQYVYAKLYSSNESSYQLIGNPNLNSERVASYEVGIKSLISPNDALSLVGYYRGIIDYITAARVIPDTLRPENAYLVYFNLDFASSRGVELEYKRKAGDFFSGSIQLGFSKTKGERSDPADIIKGIGGRSAQEIYEEYFFDWDKPWQMILGATVFSRENHLKIFGLNLPLNWDLNCNFWAHSGQRYTPYKQVISDEEEVEFVKSGEVNSKIGKFWSGLDLSFRKHFNWRGQRLSFLLEITNLFDHKNVVIINPLTGDEYQSDDVIPYSNGDPNLPDRNLKVPLWSDPSRYLEPRHIMMGVSISW
jgi:outer membrane receptor protein involved in Fe transport